MDKNLIDQQIENIVNYLESEENEFEDIIPEAISDFSDAEYEASEHDSGSEEDAESDSANNENLKNIETSEQQGSRSNAFYGRNRDKWSKITPSRSWVPAHNIIVHLSGLRGPTRAKNEMYPLHAWSCLFSEDMIELILQYTNEKITKYAVICAKKLKTVILQECAPNA